MIPKQEIMTLAAELQLQAHVVEKDYALGWFLAGIAAHPEIGPRWVFKGGTCLKKCFFETYRFSEDLDFTLPVEMVASIGTAAASFSQSSTAGNSCQNSSKGGQVGNWWPSICSHSTSMAARSGRSDNAA